MKIRPTPPEDTDGAQACVDALERAVEAVAVAYQSDEREHWEQAIEAITDTRFWALWHAGQLFTRFDHVSLSFSSIHSCQLRTWRGRSRAQRRSWPTSNRTSCSRLTWPRSTGIYIHNPAALGHRSWTYGLRRKPCSLSYRKGK